MLTALSRSWLAGEVAGGRDADVHFTVHVQEHLAGILHAPVLIRHDEAAGSRDSTAVVLYRHGQREVVIGAVDFEHALHLDAGFSLLGKAANHALGKECDLGIVRALEDLVVHVGVAIVIATLAAGRVHHNLAGGVARLRIEPYAAALQLERAVYRVHGGAQRPFDFGLRGIEIDLHLLRRTDAAQQQRHDGRGETSRAPLNAGVFHEGKHIRIFTSNAGFQYNMDVRFRSLILALVCFWLAGAALAQEPAPVEQVPVDKSAPPPKDNRKAPPRSDNIPAGESSNKQTQTDISPPSDDAKKHPGADLSDTDVNEFTPWNPMKAMKDVEVGDFYFKVKQNYPAAISRYREALEYKPHDAEATFKLAEALNKTGDTAGAVENYEAYLKILPNGPYATKAHEALDKLKTAGASSAKAAAKPQ